MNLRSIARVACLLVLCGGLAGCFIGRHRRAGWVSQQPRHTEVADADCPNVAPPAPQHEDCGVAPSTVHVWIPGHWQWKHGRYRWSTGHWTRPARHGSAWVTGHWEKAAPGQYVWVDGHWR